MNLVHFFSVCDEIVCDCRKMASPLWSRRAPESKPGSLSRFAEHASGRRLRCRKFSIRRRADRECDPRAVQGQRGGRFSGDRAAPPRSCRAGSGPPAGRHGARGGPGGDPHGARGWPGAGSHGARGWPGAGSHGARGWPGTEPARAVRRPGREPPARWRRPGREQRVRWRRPGRERRGRAVGQRRRRRVRVSARMGRPRRAKGMLLAAPGAAMEQPPWLVQARSRPPRGV